MTPLEVTPRKFGVWMVFLPWNLNSPNLGWLSSDELFNRVKALVDSAPFLASALAMMEVVQK